MKRIKTIIARLFILPLFILLAILGILGAVAYCVSGVLALIANVLLWLSASRRRIPGKYWTEEYVTDIGCWMLYFPTYIFEWYAKNFLGVS
jgi:hypothetical protein